jgi:phage/plasmid-like protein (TIGR03299 family)
MSHEITIRADGFAEAAFAKTPAWHGLGTVLPELMTSAEAMTTAGLDWEVVQKPIAFEIGKDDYREGDVVSFDGTRYFRPVIREDRETGETKPAQYANLRGDTGLYLGTVSDHYQVVQNHEAFAFLDELVENHELKYEAAFSLKGGKTVCMVAQIPGVDQVAPDDNLLKLMGLSLSHDGTGAIKFGAISLRWVCANTYQLSLSKDRKTVKDLTIRHSGNIREKLDEARRIIGAANEEFALHTETCQKLAQRTLTVQEWETFLDILCPVPHKLDPDWTERRERKIVETRDAIRAAYHGDLQQTAPRTAWAAFNAVTEHVDHLPRRGATQRQKAEARFNVTMYGPGRDQKERAFETACNIAGLPA